MDKNKKKNIAIMLSVFIISLSLFTYQIILTRLYSAILFHHYVFLTTSFAILGVGVGSILAYWDKERLKKIFGTNPAQTEKVMTQLNKGALVLSCGFILVFALIYIQPFVDSLLIYIGLGVIPFVISGYLFSVLFKVWPHISGKLYFADLLGAGVGSIAIISLLDNAGMFAAAAIICLLPSLVAVFLLPAASKKLKISQYALAAALLLSTLLPAQAANNIETNFYALLNNTGKTFGEMQRSGLSPQIVFSRWDSFARTDVIELQNIPEVKIITIDGSANAPMYEFDGNLRDMERFTGNTGYVPFAAGTVDRTLIIGAGGGRGVLYALAAGSRDIAAVEINPASIEAVRMFGDFNGHVFDRPEVRVYAADGRNFVRNTDERFDVIFLSLVVTNTTQGVGFALSENYIHTVEAMEDYLNALSADGKVAFVAHDQLSLFRLITTAIQALVNRGVPLGETPDHIAIFYQLVDFGHFTQMIAPAIIVMDRPLSEEESLAILEEIERIGATPEHIPHLHEQGFVSLLSGGLFTFDQLVNGFGPGSEPVTDNSPYFFNFERGVPAVLVQILVFSLLGTLLLFVPFIKKKKGDLWPALYFGLLGMGFMMIQIPFIQKFILYLGHPTLAFSYVLAAMLIGCGMGGFFSGHKLFREAVGRVYLPPIIAAVVCLILLLLLSGIFQQTAGFGVAGKVIVASIAVAIPGFFMGMPFPRGMILLGESNKNDVIPVMWGINGIMSVAGSVLSIILSMTFGFTAALVVGSAIYLAIGCFRKI